MRLALTLAAIGLASCAAESETVTKAVDGPAGFAPNIQIDTVQSEEAVKLQDWIDDTVTTLTSLDFENNLAKVAERYPQVWISRARDAMPTSELYDVLETTDNRFHGLWWPETFVILRGDEKSRLARTGARTETTGEIEIGRFHYQRYVEGDTVQRSCAINTMAHEISHTLSDRTDMFWMHILDSGKDGNPPPRMFEASYLIGTVAQCTWLQEQGRVSEEGFFDCLFTFSDPASGSRFRSRACDGFPDDIPIIPATRPSP